MVELAGIGPGPFAAMMLADVGADVVRVDRATERDAGTRHGPHPDLAAAAAAGRSRSTSSTRTAGRSCSTWSPGRTRCWRASGPGVTERLGLGPADCLAVNPALVYGRMTGWGQDGPLATVAGHDIGYIAVTGALNAIGRAGGRRRCRR